MWRTGCEKNLEKALMRVSAISSSYGLEADVTEKNVMAVMDSIEDLMQKRGIRFPSSCGRGHHLSQEQKDWKKMAIIFHRSRRTGRRYARRRRRSAITSSGYGR